MKFRCAECGNAPSAVEQERIDRDLAAHGAQPASWRCPECAPELLLTRSGLCFHVVTVVGASR
jgi:uncharacterized protein with PIN domain